jgi:NADH-quinone oxidoreductase E subunit
MTNVEDKSESNISTINKIMSNYQGQEWALIPLLQEIQDVIGYIPPESIQSIAKGLGLFPAQVQGVITFYEQFHTEPRGKNIVRVCRGTACHVKGGKTILKLVKQNLDVEEGENTSDLQFTLETVPCLGTCFLAPAMIINKDYYGNLAPPKIKNILQQYSDHGR